MVKYFFVGVHWQSSNPLVGVEVDLLLVQKDVEVEKRRERLPKLGCMKHESLEEEGEEKEEEKEKRRRKKKMMLPSSSQYLTCKTTSRP